MSENKSSSQALRAAATGTAVAKKSPDSFPAMLSAYKDQVAAALPKHISGDRMLRVALTAFRQNPKLAECDPKSVFACVVIGAQLGLEPGILGQAFLVPYRDKRNNVTICQFIPGWQGLADLVNRSGRASVWTGAVFEGDSFSYEYGSDPHILHKPAGNDDQPGKLTYCYAVGRVKGAEFPVIEVWSRAKIERHRDRYNRQGDRHYSYEQFEMYGRKVALLQVLKYMPKSIEMATAFALDATGESGSQSIGIKEAMEGTFAPPPDPSPEDNDAVDLVKYPETGLKSATTLEELSAAWTAVVGAHKAASVTVPINIEALYHDRKEALKQASGEGK